MRSGSVAVTTLILAAIGSLSLGLAYFVRGSGAYPFEYWYFSASATLAAGAVLAYQFWRRCLPDGDAWGVLAVTAGITGLFAIGCVVIAVLDTQSKGMVTFFSIGLAASVLTASNVAWKQRRS